MLYFLRMLYIPLKKDVIDVIDAIHPKDVRDIRDVKG